MKKNNNYKYSAIFEGETEKIIFNELKVNIIRSNKLSLCKKHGSKNNEGTININKIKNFNCCKQIIIMDEDELENIDEYIKRRNKSNLIIISSPLIEIILCCIFTIPNKNENKRNIISGLSSFLSNHWDNKSKSFKYIKDSNLIKEIIKIVSEEEKYREWKENLSKLHKDNKNNFIELLDFLEKFRGE
ncbi:MAG: hypothetical protein HDR43_00630 [Mycoplasma sp.]|nr:hypothetical protein [Mycoplasma sp.]